MSDDEEYRDNLYSPLQSQVLTLIPMFTASLSVIGSSIIIYIILSDRKRKLQRVYHRLLLAFSSVDWCFSINLGLSALVVPKGTPGVWGALGNQATCEASGFVTQFGQSSGLYSAFMCLYYLLILRYDVRETTIAKRVEPFIHLFAFFFPLINAIIMLSLDLYNPTNIVIGWCFTNVYPADCLRREEVECERGGEGYALWLMVNLVPFFFYFAVVLVSSILTYLQVRSLELRTSSLWTFNNQSRLKTKETSIQASLYIIAFFFTYGIFGLTSVAGPSPATEEYRHVYFPLVVLIKVFLPLQGFWNCVIFVRPRYSALKRRNRNMKASQIIKQIVLYSNEAAQRRQRQRNKRRREEEVDQISSGGEPHHGRPVVVVDGDTTQDEFTPEIDTDDHTAQDWGESEIFEDTPYETNSFPTQVFRMDAVIDNSSEGSSCRHDSSSKQESSVLSGEEEYEGTSDVASITAQGRELEAAADETKLQQSDKVVASKRKSVAFVNTVVNRQREEREPTSLLGSLMSREEFLALSAEIEEADADEAKASKRQSVKLDARPTVTNTDLIDQRHRDQKARRSIAFLGSTILGESDFDDLPLDLSAKRDVERDDADCEDRGVRRLSMFQLGASRNKADAESQGGNRGRRRLSLSVAGTEKNAAEVVENVAGQEKNSRRRRASLFSRATHTDNYGADVADERSDETP
mmetsp:Transcript_18897/g.31250  ORF Transcript_18897/g.31250 Transcript_18897/m.31250 type:complete len:693 (-) Transcript_18897:68-2146(-)